MQEWWIFEGLTPFLIQFGGFNFCRHSLILWLSTVCCQRLVPIRAIGVKLCNNLSRLQSGLFADSNILVLDGGVSYEWCCFQALWKLIAGLSHPLPCWLRVLVQWVLVAGASCPMEIFTFSHSKRSVDNFAKVTWCFIQNARALWGCWDYRTCMHGMKIIVELSPKDWTRPGVGLSPVLMITLLLAAPLVLAVMVDIPVPRAHPRAGALLSISMAYCTLFYTFPWFIHELPFMCHRVFFLLFPLWLMAFISH